MLNLFILSFINEKSRFKIPNLLYLNKLLFFERNNFKIFWGKYFF